MEVHYILSGDSRIVDAILKTFANPIRSGALKVKRVEESNSRVIVADDKYVSCDCDSKTPTIDQKKPRRRK